MGTSLTLFTRLLGLALAVPIGQSIFQQALASRLGTSVAAQIFGSGGATDIRVNLERIFGSDTPELESALLEVNSATAATFVVCLVMAALSFPFALLVEWKNVKTTQLEAKEPKDPAASKGDIEMT